MARTALSMSLAAVFALLSLFHVVGALGAWRSLAVIPSVPGQPPHFPAPLSWMGVAVALAMAALVVLVRGEVLFRSFPRKLATVACVTLGAVFVLRTIGDFRFFGVFRRVTDTSFAFWDSWLYTPLCLAIGLGALFLAVIPRDPARSSGEESSR